MTIRDKVLAVIEQVASEQDKKLPPLDDKLRLIESGLDSLALAVVVARLEDQLETDPFDTVAEVALPVTLGDFIALYERALA